MAKIELRNVAHSYNAKEAEKTYALKPFNLTWENGGRYAVLGPSGCGKTTMLNIISGLLKPSEGKIIIDGIDLTEANTATRNIAQVFQFPVIYGTMTVYENLAFPLVCRNFPKEAIRAKVEEVAELLNLTSHLTKRAKKLTADQKQLISMGRGLVRDDVAAVLMDEPLTVIDPDLKFELRLRLKTINQNYGSTMIYVTHDQNEAMTFAQKIIVMNHGEVVQVGTPQELFDRPQTTFVGYFIGAPAMNIFECALGEGNSIRLENFKLKTSTSIPQSEASKLKLGIRSEYIKIVDQNAENTILAQPNEVQDFGNYKLLTATFGESIIKVKYDRKMGIPADQVHLQLPATRCNIYENDRLI
jgi:glycerol transport system ATP-binding protein